MPEGVPFDLSQGPDPDTVHTEQAPGDGSAPEVATANPGLFRRAGGSAARLFLRALFAYLILFAYPFPLQTIPDVRAIPQIWHDRDIPAALVNWNAPGWIDEAYTWRFEHAQDWRSLERRAVDWAASDVFGFTRTLDRPNGSGDVTYGYVKVATRAGAAVAIALLWSLLALLVVRLTRIKGSLVGFLGPWMHLYGRYYLAVVLLGYGLAKVYPSQFRTPSFARMEAPYGDGSPMNILWNFMGSSNGYIVFSGVMEVLPALLLLFRRTALMGALLGAAVMANVVLLNYCYDVPVKILSTHLLVLACALASVDLKRLVHVFLLNRPALPRDLSRPRTGWVGHLVRVLVLVPYLGLAADRVVEKYRHPREPYELTGIWDVESFRVDGEERIPRTDDALRFQALIIDSKRWVNLKTMDGSQRGLKLTPSKNGDRLTLRSESDWYYRIGDDGLVLTGEHTRQFRPEGDAENRRVELRDPQLELTLRKDPDFALEEKARSRRNRLPEALLGRWVLDSQEFVGDASTRKRATPFGWTAATFEPNGDVTFEYPLCEQEFKASVDAYNTTSPAEANVQRPDGKLTLKSTSRLKLKLPEEGRMHLQGNHRGNDVEIELQLRDPSSFLLTRRGFHWINEIPLNRY